ncbi:MAG: hypothetical protein WCV56_08620 [Candidatus Omnitrophota bacterium]
MIKKGFDRTAFMHEAVKRAVPQTVWVVFAAEYWKYSGRGEFFC